uniref:Uncharacterized protein n=1 Tax=Cacopsylla melanoneura TaxID=428564 RepID=A0A8D9E1I2_9HEMI
MVLAVSYTLFGNYQVPPKTHNVNRGRLVLTGFPSVVMNSSCQRVPITTQCGNYQVPTKTTCSTKLQFPPKNFDIPIQFPPILFPQFCFQVEIRINIKNIEYYRQTQPLLFQPIIALPRNLKHVSYYFLDIIIIMNYENNGHKKFALGKVRKMGMSNSLVYG